MPVLVRRKMRVVLIAILVTAVAAVAQVPTQPRSNPAAVDVSLSNLLSQLETTSQTASTNLGKMKIDKWKADGDIKRQAQSNAELLQRNLSTTLPEMVAQIRQAPQDSAVTFRLYRQFSAVYDTFASLTEEAGAFGAKDQYQALAEQVAAMDTLRRNLADRMQALTTVKEAELAQLRTQLRSAAQSQAAAPPKKIVVDDAAGEPKPKKKKAKPAATPPS